jgi:origin recognition complex subunit 3
MHTHTITEPQTAHINQIKKEHKTALLDSKNLSDLPDTAVLFRRYLDSGRVINVYDWFESFAQAMTSEREEPGPEDGTRMDADEWDDGDKDDKDGEWRREIQARFLRGVHELDWNGLLRSTGRKRDHVARTLFDPPPPGYDAL